MSHVNKKLANIPVATATLNKPALTRDGKVRPQPLQAGIKLLGKDKIARAPANITPTTNETRIQKPNWIRAKFPGGKAVRELKETLRKNNLHSVCEEANCPNLGECFGKGVASFMIMGAICTRRCTFCAVAHGRPNLLDPNEPENLARTIAEMKLRHVVITSVDRDDLLDGGAQHFVDCIRKVREYAPNTTVETLTPDFRGREQKALDILLTEPPDIFNHNLETTERLYRDARPGSDYQVSLDLLKNFKKACPSVPTKSGLMVGLGETDDEVYAVMRDMRAHDVDMLTIGQYLQPSNYHLPVKRYVTPAQFERYEATAIELGFTHVAAGPLVRSSYFADEHAQEIL
ncbi:lipoyl synthase [Cardiobacteriales bacterium ML27]|uniref:Lipoyl synthase n=2 Tax=Ostreibacterium oceani TaxID=2654998 RepID=A0A6N7EZY6_9GAMM|nr:lipoyl synthase [Ostreibacterium oceani]